MCYTLFPSSNDSSHTLWIRRISKCMHSPWIHFHPLCCLRSSTACVWMMQCACYIIIERTNYCYAFSRNRIVCDTFIKMNKDNGGKLRAFLPFCWFVETASKHYTIWIYTSSEGRIFTSSLDRVRSTIISVVVIFYTMNAGAMNFCICSAEDEEKKSLF